MTQIRCLCANNMAMIVFGKEVSSNRDRGFHVTVIPLGHVSSV